jgi:hypothetical protein
MDKPFDNGVEVDDAIRLGDAFTQIRETFQARQLSDEDRAHPSFSFYTKLARDMPFYEGDSARDDWVRRTVLKKLSEEKVSNALKSGDLPVYFITRNQTPVRLNRDEFCRRNWNSHITITAGSYHNENGDNHLGSPFHGAHLWVKAADWKAYFAQIVGPIIRSAGRPNKRDEAITLHNERLAQGFALQGKAAEARAIQAILTNRHKGESNWQYSSVSIQKALREAKSQGD